MSHRIAAALTVRLQDAGAALARRLRDDRGQGTVEYVALLLLVAGVLAAVVAWAKTNGDTSIGKSIVTKLKDSIDGVGGAAAGGISPAKK